MIVTCPDCNKYSGEYLGSHIQKTSCSYPELSSEQIEIITGILMGDGNVGRRNKDTPRIKCSNTNKIYLKHLQHKFPLIGTGVSLNQNAAECAKRDRKSGFNESADKSNYDDMYRWRTRSIPSLNKFANWYQSGIKVFPEGVTVTPIVLKHWYACDGHYSNKNGNNYISIACSNEGNNSEKLKSYFSNIVNKEDISLSESVRVNGSMKYDMYFNTENSKVLFDYMGEPLPGFEYKWPN